MNKLLTRKYSLPLENRKNYITLTVLLTTQHKDSQNSIFIWWQMLLHVVININQFSVPYKGRLSLCFTPTVNSWGHVMTVSYTQVS